MSLHVSHCVLAVCVSISISIVTAVTGFLPVYTAIKKVTITEDHSSLKAVLNVCSLRGASIPLSRKRNAEPQQSVLFVAKRPLSPAKIILYPEMLTTKSNVY